MVLLNTVNIVETNGELRLIKEDPKDDVILESAIENDVDFLISGDEHLLKIKKYSNTKIVTAAEFLELIKNYFLIFTACFVYNCCRSSF